MGFEGTFGKDIAAVDFGTGRYLRHSKERTHLSKAVLDTYSNVEYLEVGKFHRGVYRNAADVRYLAATGMSYDLLISIYDVNTQSMFACRLFGFEESAREQIIGHINPKKRPRIRPNFEVRIIGLQSKQSVNYLNQIADLVSATGVKLVEADLFGGETRHIALDLKLGVSQDVLLEDRLYRPGELINKTTLEQFERALKQ